MINTVISEFSITYTSLSLDFKELSDVDFHICRRDGGRSLPAITEMPRFGLVCMARINDSNNLNIKAKLVVNEVN